MDYHSHHHSHLNFTALMNADERSLEWPMIKSPGKLLMFILFYVYFCKKLGPSMMEGRKPFDLRGILIIYNIYQIAMNAVIFAWTLAIMYAVNFNFMCQPVKQYDGSIESVIFLTAYFYLISRFVDILDTVFFVLTKKYSHISGLHLFHHSFMPMGNWLGFTLAPDGHGAFYAVANSFVHIVMYTYYLVAAMGPEFKKYLWWKKYLTLLQIAQFFLVCIHEAIPLFFIECNYPKILSWLCFLMGLVFTVLFSQFYYYTYIVGPRKVMHRREIADGVINGYSKASTKKDLEQTWGETTSQLLNRNRQLIKCPQ